MRIIISTLALSALVGCAAQDDVALEHRSLQEVQARGVALNEAGTVANVGMRTTTCDFGTSSGLIQDDFDYVGTDDRVVDSGVNADLGTVNLVVIPDGIGITTPDGWVDQSEIPAVGVVDAAVLDAGLVEASAQADGCTVSWRAYDGAVTSQVTTDFSCATVDLSADDASGTVFLSTASGVHRVTAEGDVLALDTTPNALIAWDASADALYVAAPGSEEVTAFETDGAVRWSTPVMGGVSALSEMGSTGQVALSLDTELGGEFVVLNGLSGLQTADLATPSAASALSVSGNGQVLAITLPSAVHYFDIATR
jgi:hypothetical protein